MVCHPAQIASIRERQQEQRRKASHGRAGSRAARFVDVVYLAEFPARADGCMRFRRHMPLGQYSSAHLQKRALQVRFLLLFSARSTASAGKRRVYASFQERSLSKGSSRWSRTKDRLLRGSRWCAYSVAVALLEGSMPVLRGHVARVLHSAREAESGGSR